jgi:hypothetical protein
MGPQARVVARFGDGSAAAVVSSFGKGKTLMLGSYVSAAYQSTPSEVAERFFFGLLNWAGVTMPVAEAGKEIEVRLLEAGGERLVFVFNHAKQPAQAAVSLRIGEGEFTALDLMENRAVALRRDAGTIRFDARLEPSGVQVLSLRPRR